MWSNQDYMNKMLQKEMRIVDLKRCELWYNIILCYVEADHSEYMRFSGHDLNVWMRIVSINPELMFALNPKQIFVVCHDLTQLRVFLMYAGVHS